MRARRRHLGAVLVILIVAAAACTSSAPQTIHYDDVDGSRRYPLLGDGGYSAGVWTQRRGDPFSASIVLDVSRPATVHIERIDLITKSANLEVIGVLAAGPKRGLGQAMGAEGFPPVHLPPSMRTRYWPIEHVPVTEARSKGGHGVDVIIGLRFQTGQRAWFDGLQVTYRVGGRRYVGRFRVAWGMCMYTPCEAPGIGKPWGDQR